VNIIVLDDNENRQSFFKKVFPNKMSAYTSKQAKCLLKTYDNKNIVLFLDHDLAPGNFRYGSKNTGSEVVNYIIDTKIRIEKIIVHSMNINGQGERMYKTLLNVENVRKVFRIKMRNLKIMSLSEVRTISEK